MSLTEQQTMTIPCQTNTNRNGMLLPSHVAQLLKTQAPSTNPINCITQTPNVWSGERRLLSVEIKFRMGSICTTYLSESSTNGWHMVSIHFRNAYSKGVYECRVCLFGREEERKDLKGIYDGMNIYFLGEEANVT